MQATQSHVRGFSPLIGYSGLLAVAALAAALIAAGIGGSIGRSMGAPTAGAAPEAGAAAAAAALRNAAIAEAGIVQARRDAQFSLMSPDAKAGLAPAKVLVPRGQRHPFNEPLVTRHLSGGGGTARPD